MAFERLVGLNVTDDTRYQQYREGMMPILETYGGSFGYDFRIAEVLKSQAEHPVNRVFTIRFPDEDAMHGFFADEAYLEVREQYFESSVDGATIIATYPIDE